MSKVDNRKGYKHNIDLVKYSEDGLRKRCMLCVEEIGEEEKQNSGFHNKCWADYQRLGRHGGLVELQESYKYKWIILEEKYQNLKKCNTCFEIKTKDNFYPDKKAVHGLQNKCKSCIKVYNKKFGYISERDTLYQRNRRLIDIDYKIKDIISTNIHSSLKSTPKKYRTIKYLGCRIDEYKIYLLNMFKPEMNWGNYGEIWEIDHIKPKAKFNMSIEEEILECFNYKNTQPLFKTTEIAESFGYKNYIGNREKSDNYEL